MKYTNVTPLTAGVIIILVFSFLVLSPVFTITALNTLFGLTIPVTIGTWFATFWLQLLFISRFRN